MRRLLLILPLLLVGCDAPPDTIAGRALAKIEKACQFRADQAWLEDVIVKAGITVQMVDQLVKMVCDGVTAAKSAQSLVSPECPNGTIVVNGEPICIEGDPLPNDEPEKEGE